jgi:hypothetical protein
MFSMPKKGTLERLMVEKMLEHPEGVTFLDFVGTGITEDNIDKIAQNLRNAMYEAEDDHKLKEDA